MMDAEALVPRGFHPVLYDMLPDNSDIAPQKSRATVPVKYYYTDFGISSHFQPGESSLVSGDQGLDQQVPELSDDVPYDAFKVDIFIIGNLLKSECLAVSGSINCHACEIQLDTPFFRNIPTWACYSLLSSG